MSNSKNTLVKNNDGRKRSKYYRNTHKAMIFPVSVYQLNKKLYVIVQHKKECKLEFVDHLWLPFLDQPHLDIVVFEIIDLQIYDI